MCVHMCINVYICAHPRYPPLYMVSKNFAHMCDVYTCVYVRIRVYMYVYMCIYVPIFATLLYIC